MNSTWDMPVFQVEVANMTMQTVNSLHDANLKNFEEWKTSFANEILNMLTLGQMGTMEFSNELSNIWSQLTMSVDRLQKDCQFQHDRLNSHETMLQERIALVSQNASVSHANLLDVDKFRPMVHQILTQAGVPERQQFEQLQTWCKNMFAHLKNDGKSAPPEVTPLDRNSIEKMMLPMVRNLIHENNKFIAEKLDALQRRCMSQLTSLDNAPKMLTNASSMCTLAQAQQLNPNCDAYDLLLKRLVILERAPHCNKCGQLEENIDHMMQDMILLKGSIHYLNQTLEETRNFCDKKFKSMEASARTQHEEFLKWKQMKQDDGKNEHILITDALLEKFTSLESVVKHQQEEINQLKIKMKREHDAPTCRDPSHTSLGVTTHKISHTAPEHVRQEKKQVIPIAPEEALSMDRHERGRLLSMQQHDAPNMRMGLPLQAGNPRSLVTPPPEVSVDGTSRPPEGRHVAMQKKMRALSAPPRRCPGTDVSETNSDEDSHGHGKPDAYTTKELCKTLIGTPSWNGKGLTWKSFRKEWKAYWEFQKGLVGPKQKKWIFIRCLPEKWRSHMKAHITDAEWS